MSLSASEQLRREDFTEVGNLLMAVALIGADAKVNRAQKQPADCRCLTPDRTGWDLNTYYF
jgi:hypothetical protein